MATLRIRFQRPLLSVQQRRSTLCCPHNAKPARSARVVVSAAPDGPEKVVDLAEELELQRAKTKAAELRGHAAELKIKKLRKALIEGSFWMVALAALSFGTSGALLSLASAAGLVPAFQLTNSMSAGID